MPNKEDEFNEKDAQLGYHEEGEPTSRQIAFQDQLTDATNNYLIEMSTILREHRLKHEDYTEDDYQLEQLQPIMDKAIEKLGRNFDEIF